MNIDKDLALLLSLASTFVMEDTEDEEALDKLKRLFEKIGINTDTFERSDVNTEKEFVNWIENAVNRIQLCIEEYEALERGN